MIARHRANWRESFLSLSGARRVLFVTLVVSAVAVTVMSHRGNADDDEDEERALNSGEVVPVEQLLAKIRQTIGGRILLVELEQEWRVGGRIWVYEAKILAPDGNVLKLEYDARTLEVLESKGRRSKTPGHEAED